MLEKFRCVSGRGAKHGVYMVESMGGPKSVGVRTEAWPDARGRLASRFIVFWVEFVIFFRNRQRRHQSTETRRERRQYRANDECTRTQFSFSSSFIAVLVAVGRLVVCVCVCLSLYMCVSVCVCTTHNGGRIRRVTTTTHH